MRAEKSTPQEMNIEFKMAKAHAQTILCSNPAISEGDLSKQLFSKLSRATARGINPLTLDENIQLAVTHVLARRS